MVRVRVSTPCRGSVRVRTTSRGGGYLRGVFSVGELSPGKLSPGGGGYFLQTRLHTPQWCSISPIVENALVTER